MAFFGPLENNAIEKAISQKLKSKNIEKHAFQMKIDNLKR